MTDQSKMDYEINGKIRNILANEHGLNRGMVGRDALVSVVKGIVAGEITGLVRGRMAEDQQFKIMVEKAVRSAVTAEVKRLLGEKIEQATDQINFKIHIEQTPDNTSEHFGKF